MGRRGPHEPEGALEVIDFGLEVAGRGQLPRETAWRFVELQQRGGVVDDGLDLLAIADDAGVRGQAVDVGGVSAATFSLAKPSKASRVPSHLLKTTFQLIPAVKITLLMISR